MIKVTRPMGLPLRGVDKAGPDIDFRLRGGPTALVGRKPRPFFKKALRHERGTAAAPTHHPRWQVPPSHSSRSVRFAEMDGDDAKGA